MKILSLVITALASLTMGIISSAWADTSKTDGLALTVSATLVNSPCQIIIGNDSNINLDTVARTDVAHVEPGAIMSNGAKIIAVTFERCADSAYALRFTGPQASAYPGALTHDPEQGIADYLKYVDSTNTFYPDGTLLGDGHASSINHMNLASTFTFQLEAGYMRIDGSLVSGKTLTPVTLDIIRN